MRIALVILVCLAAVSVAYIWLWNRPVQAMASGHFDVSQLGIPELKEPDWHRRLDGDRVRYLCVNAERCPMPTGIDIKGVIRPDELPAAFESGEASPETLLLQGRANAQRTGSQFLAADPIEIDGIKGVHMEASGEMGGTVYFVTRWIGQGHRMLDVKVTTRDLGLARQLSDTAIRSLLPQVFGAAEGKK